MDETIEVDKCPWPIEDIPNPDLVYRQVFYHDLIGTKKRRFPNEAHFIPHPDGLSVYWGRHISIRDIFLLIGLSYKTSQPKYKDHTFFRVFKFNVGFVRSIDGVKGVMHTPRFNGNPSPIGFPNIRAHASILYPMENDDALQIRTNLSDYCRDFHDTAFCPFEVNSINEELNELRDRLNNTRFHKIVAE